MQKLKGLILSGGYGTRLRPITYFIQKQLIPVANKPIIFYGIEELVRCGITDIGIIVGHNQEQVKEIVGDGSRWGCKITYIYQEQPSGLAHAVKIAKPFLKNNKFVMYLGDNILQNSIKPFINKFLLYGSNTMVLLHRVNNPKHFGIAKLNEDGSIAELLEKPENPPTNLAIVGVYFFDSKIFNAIEKITPSPRGELEITDAMQYQIKHKCKVDSAILKGWWKDTGSIKDIIRAEKLIFDKLPMKGKTRIEGTVLGRGEVEYKFIFKNAK